MEKSKNKKVKIGIIIGIILLFSLIVIKVYVENTTFVPYITDINNIDYILVEDIDNEKEYKLDKDNTKIVFNIISNLKSKKSSNSDKINNDSYLISFVLKKEENTNTPLLGGYLYKNNNKYYFEQPYNGIFELNESDYNKIIKIIKHL